MAAVEETNGTPAEVTDQPAVPENSTAEIVPNTVTALVQDNESTNPFDEFQGSGPTNPFDEGHSSADDVIAEAGDDENAPSVDENLENNSTEIEVSQTGPEPKENAPTQEESAKYEESRKAMQDDLIAVTKYGRKRKTMTELGKLSTRDYLDETVVPHLLVGMSELSRQRPEKPLAWLAKFLEREQEKESILMDRGDSDNRQQKSSRDSLAMPENGTQEMAVSE